MLGLNDAEIYRVVTFRMDTMKNMGKFTNAQMISLNSRCSKDRTSFAITLRTGVCGGLGRILPKAVRSNQILPTIMMAINRP